MATLNWPSTPAQDRVTFTPIPTALVNLRNSQAGTIAVLARCDSSRQAEFAGLVNAGISAWYHGLTADGTNHLLGDDDGVNATNAQTLTVPDGSGGADYFFIGGVDWQATGANTERYHISATMGSAESWSHENSAGNNGNTMAANSSGTDGLLCIGDFSEGITMRGDIALIGIWAGTRFSDTDWTNLWINKKTSDWWNHPAGNPTTLIECISLSPTDIGSAPSTFSARTSGVTLTGLVPTGWTFDGRGAEVQTAAATADSVDGNWTDQADGTTLFEAINETSAATADYIKSELVPQDSGCRVKLDSLDDPGSSTGHIIHWQAGKDATGGATINMTVKLYQGGGNSLGGGTLIKSAARNNVDAFTTYDETLSSGEADSITNYADLYLEFWADTA